MRKAFVEPVVLPEPRFRDGLGIRYVRTNGAEGPVEVLRPLWELAAMRATIQSRVGRLTTFRQARFVPVRATEVPPDNPSTIEVVSDYVPGNRLSEILDAAKAGRVVVETDAALYVVREMLGAIAVLHESRKVTHGAIGPESILITPRGRILVADYVLGAAIERLDYTRSRLWREFRIPMAPGTGRARFDELADVMQIGVLALALLVGRPIETNEYPDQLQDLLASIGAAAEREGREPVPKPLFAWLKRMLPREDNGSFATVRDARIALEAVLSKQRQALNGAAALKSLAEAFERQVAADAAPAQPAAAGESRPTAVIPAEAFQPSVKARPANASPIESGTNLVPALTLLPDPAVERAVDVDLVGSDHGVGQDLVADADPPVGWRVPETHYIEEPVVAGTLLEAEPLAVAAVPDDAFGDDVLDLDGLIEDDLPFIVPVPDAGCVEEPLAARTLLEGEPPAVAAVPDHRLDGDVLDLGTVLDAGLLVVAPVPETGCVEKPLAARTLPGTEPPVVAAIPYDGLDGDVLDLGELLDAGRLVVAPVPETGCVEEPLAARTLLEAEPPVVAAIPCDGLSGDVLDVGELPDAGRLVVARDPETGCVEEPLAARTLPGTEPPAVAAVPHSGMDLEVLDLSELLEPDLPVVVPVPGAGRVDERLSAGQLLRNGDPGEATARPCQPASHAEAPVADAAPVIPRVAPSVQQVRAAAARRRMSRVRAGLAVSARAVQGAGRTTGSAGAAMLGVAARVCWVTASAGSAACLLLLSTLGRACFASVRVCRAGSALALAKFARTMLVSARGIGSAGAATMFVCARILRAAMRSVLAVGRLLLRALVHAGVAAAGAGHAAGSMAAAGVALALRMIGGAGRASAAAVRITARALLRSVAIAGRGAVRLVYAAGGLLLRAFVHAGVAAAGAGRTAGSMAAAGVALALRMIEGAGRTSAAAVRIMARALLRSMAIAGHGAGVIVVTVVTVAGRTVAVIARVGRVAGSDAVAASVHVGRVLARVLRVGSARALAASSWAPRGTVRATASAGVATLSASLHAFRFAADLARRIPRPVVRPVYVVCTLLALVAVAGTPLVKAHWFSSTPTVGTLRVESAQAGVAVKIDGVAHGNAPLSTTLAVGRHRVEVGGGGRTRVHDVIVTAEHDTIVQAARGGSLPSGTLRIASDPPGAEVWLDGELHGNAPLTIENVTAGSHTLLVRETAASVRRTVRVRAGETVAATIPIRPGWLAVFAPVRLEILEEGRVIGTTERGRILVQPGEHTLEVVSDSLGFRATHKVEVKPGEVAALTIDLPASTLEIVAPSGAEIRIDGQPIGKAPLGPIAVAVGTREVTMRHPALGEQRQIAIITYSTPNRVVFEPR